MTPFRDLAKTIAKKKGLAGMAAGCDHVRSQSWWGNLVSHGPWKGSGDARVFPPPIEALTGIAKLFETSEAELREMIAADWYGVVHDKVIPPAVLELAP